SDPAQPPRLAAGVPAARRGATTAAARAAGRRRGRAGGGAARGPATRRHRRTLIMATIRFGNPEGVHSTGGRYSHAALIEGGPARRLVISGQVGLKPDGSLAEDGEAQVE